LPHSRQHVLGRDVINPQNGHMRCDPKSLRFMPNDFLNDSVIEANARRTRAAD